MKFQSIALERGGCYGPCPIYRVTIHGDGSVEWEGGNFFKEEGARSWSISEEKINAIEALLERAKFTGLRNKYMEYRITDRASAKITVQIDDGDTRTVEHYFGDDSAPAALTWLENKIDEIAGTKPYIGSE